MCKKRKDCEEMSISAILDKADSLKIFMKDKYKVLLNGCIDVMDWVLEYKMTALISLNIVLGVSTQHHYLFVLISVIEFCVYFIDRMISHKEKMEKINIIDINFFNFTKDIKMDPLDAYVDDCFDRYILLYRGFKKGQYITEKEERDILNGLISEVIRYMSPIMIEKLELYYGKGRVAALLSTKCYLRVSLFCADQKKMLYVEADEKAKKEAEALMKQNSR